MNLPILQSEVKTMSSREIATLCEKKHRNVLRDIDLLNETYTHMGLPKIEQGYYTHPNTGSHYTKNVVKNQNSTESEVDILPPPNLAVMAGESLMS